MDIHLFALAFVAALCPMLVLVKGHPLIYLYGNFWRRTKVRHTSTQPTQINLALTEGQTIVGVSDTSKAMCFYIGADIMDERNYE